MSHQLLDAWQRTLRRHRAAPAVTEASTGVVTTFGELDRRARAWLERQEPAAAALRARVVVFALPNGAAWFDVFLGLMHAGATAVALDAAEPAASQAALAESLRAAFWWDGIGLRPLPGRARRFADPEVCLVKLTSGSTGRPRPLVFTAAQMLADGRQVSDTMGITARDLNYALIPFGHSYGLGNLTIPLLDRGVPVVVGSSPLPQAVAAEFVRWRPTVLPGVPAVFRGLALSDVDPAALASLRLAISAGAPLTPEVAQGFHARFGRRIHGFYGSSETGGISYDRTGEATLAGRSVGRPMRRVRLRPLARQRLQVCSASVFTLANRRRRGRMGCWIPADRAALTAGGEVVLLGRRGTMVKIAGRRIDLAEVAARLRRIPGVADAWVGVAPGVEPVLGAALVTGLTQEAVKAVLQADTARWKTPKRWALLREFPLTGRGKTDTRALQTMVFG
jgi:long-chain acyl-CoA synthetase